MSLDGFVGGPNDEVDQLHAWSTGGDIDFTVPGSENDVMKVAAATADLLRRGPLLVQSSWDGAHSISRTRGVANLRSAAALRRHTSCAG